MNMTTTKPKLDVRIRWMIRRDMPDVLAIENQCFEFPWDEKDFIIELRQQRIVGFMLYELLKDKLHVRDFAVHEDFRYKGVGAAMVLKLTSKLSHDRRDRVVLEIRESNLDAQLFFKRLGFRAVAVLRDFYEDAPDDAYRFVRRFTDAP